MIFFKIFICIFLSLNIFAAENYIDSITLTKVKKLIEKEEEVALAYKKYLLDKGEIPTEIQTLIDTKDNEGNYYLPKGFDKINPFGREIKFTSSTSYSTNDSLPDNVEVKTNLFDYYYSNKYRHYTKAPISVNNNKVEINLSTKEKFIYTNREKITTTKSDARSKYYLDTKGVLHWYDNSGDYKFSVDKDLIIDSSVTILNSDGSISTEFANLMKDKNVTFAGQTILHHKNGAALEYLYLGANVGIVKVNAITRDVGKTIIQFSRRAGGMIVNGDIYTWGNNANNITGINLKKYTTETGSTGSSNRYPTITSMVRVKAKIYNTNKYYMLDSSNKQECKAPIGTGNVNCKYTNTNCNPPTEIGTSICKDIGIKAYEENYYSSPLRPKFIDFFSTVFHSTCGISTEGGLYCGGSKGEVYSFGDNFTHTDKTSVDTNELLYRSTFFNGISNKASKIFANNQIWLILSQDGDIYRWGYDSGSGFSGNGISTFNYTNRNYDLDPEKLTIIESSTNVKFTDITYLLTMGYRKMGALSTTGDIYIWGMEENISNLNCNETWESITFNLCAPTKVTASNSTLSSNITFQSIYGGLEAFIALSTDGKYYKIHQPKNKKIQVELINDTIKNVTRYKYKEADDTNLLSVDFSSKLDGSTLKWNEGIVWVNEKNELKGDYFTADNSNDQIFIDAIKKIKWKKIKVISDDNGMCGIDIYNQMYCWGIQSFYRNVATTNDDIGNTFMIPVFNTNLFDLNRDYLVAEGGRTGYLTNMTSEKWKRESDGAFFIKYPTYIGGFNYEFTFK